MDKENFRGKGVVSKIKFQTTNTKFQSQRRKSCIQDQASSIEDSYNHSVAKPAAKASLIFKQGLTIYDFRCFLSHHSTFITHKS